MSLIQLKDPLDEPEFYCVDVPGAGSGVRLQMPLQMHTCKLRDAEDEKFAFDRPFPSQLFMPEYALCVQAGTPEAGSGLYLRKCSDSTLQRFFLSGDTTIRLRADGEETLCWVMASGSGIPTGGPSHLRRDLLLQKCAEAGPALSQWTLPGFVPR